MKVKSYKRQSEEAVSISLSCDKCVHQGKECERFGKFDLSTVVGFKFFDTFIDPLCL